MWSLFASSTPEIKDSSFSLLRFAVITGGVSLVLFGIGYAMVGVGSVIGPIGDIIDDSDDSDSD